MKYTFTNFKEPCIFFYDTHWTLFGSVKYKNSNLKKKKTVKTGTKNRFLCQPCLELRYCHFYREKSIVFGERENLNS